jgi:hypothetical protein
MLPWNKVPPPDLNAHLEQIRAISRADRKAKKNKATFQQQTITAPADELQEIKARNRNWSLQQDLRPGAHNKNSKYTSNKTHYSPVDPDARIAVKPASSAIWHNWLLMRRTIPSRMSRQIMPIKKITSVYRRCPGP